MLKLLKQLINTQTVAADAAGTRWASMSFSLEERLLLSAVIGTNDSFESGLPAHWSIPSIGGEGRVSVRDLVAEGLLEVDLSAQFTRPGNENALVFDSSRLSGDSLDDLSVAIMDIDLSSTSSALLTFHQLESLRGDNNHVLPDVHTLTSVGDGLAISSNGTDWYKLENIEGPKLREVEDGVFEIVDNLDGSINRSGDGLWQLFEFDLFANIDRINTDHSAGLTTASPLQIKFSQYDDDVYPRRGWAIDNVQLKASSPTFTTSEPKGVFHRFSLNGELESDYYFRAAVFGDVDAATPILVSTHGTKGDNVYSGHSRHWHRFVADPSNNVDSLIVVSPAFVESTGPGRFNTPVRYNQLSWNTSDDAAADIALLESIDAITDAGIGDGDNLLLWGFSAGGQFTTRFTAAHPDKVAAAVVGGPATHIFPDDAVSFPFGFGADPDRPLPTGVNLDKAEYLQSRIMYWVGQEDDDPRHDSFVRGPITDSQQGITRLQRSLSQFRAMQHAATENGLTDSDFEYELLISEGDGHGWGLSDLSEIYEFLTRDHAPDESAVKVHSRVVLTPTPFDEADYLPLHVDRIAAGDNFFVELWVEAPGATGVRTGALELFFDSSFVTASSLEHGQFTTDATGTIDNAAGRIRTFGGVTTSNNAGVGSYALLGRVHFTASASLVGSAESRDVDGEPVAVSAAEFIASPQRVGASEFVLTTDVSQRTDILPLPSTTVHLPDTGTGTLLGTLFSDGDADGVRQANETGLSTRTVSLSLSPLGPVAVNQFLVEPDDTAGSGAYVNTFSPAVTLSAVGSHVADPGARVSEKGSDESSTGTIVFANNQTNGALQSQFLEDSRELRMDFTFPTKSVSIDVIAKLNDSSDRGRIEVFDSNGQLLESLTSSTLANAAYETLTITRPTADIASALAFGVDGQNVRLDNLRFSSELITQTDAEGHFSWEGIPSGTYYVSANTESDELQSAGPTPSTPVALLDTRSTIVSLGLTTLDFGDAPDSHGTTLSSDGARHGMTGPMLGASRDAEADGLPAVDAGDSGTTGDDGDGVDDEDGVVLTSNLIQDETVSFDVTASATGFLNAWIDANQDGDFLDLGEHFLVNEAVTAGVNNLDYDVPAEVLPGETFVRFRLTSESVGSPSPVGLLPDGEVEDYAVDVLPGAPTITTTNDQTFSDNQFGLDWDAVPGAEGYEVWYTYATTGAAPFIREDVATNSFTPGTPLPIGRYFIWVRVKQGDGSTSAWSDPINATVSVPAVLDPIEFQQTDLTPEFTWAEIPGATRYEIWGNNVTTGTSQIITDTNIVGDVVYSGK